MNVTNNQKTAPTTQSNLKPKPFEKEESKSFADVFETVVAKKETSKTDHEKEDELKNEEKKKQLPETEKCAKKSEKDGAKQDSDPNSSNENEQNLNPLLQQLTNQFFQVENLNLPPNARLILHTVDLERIISSAQTLKNRNNSEITINLVKSIFEGLQVKISIVAGEGLVVNFLAKN